MSDSGSDAGSEEDWPVSGPWLEQVLSGHHGAAVSLDRLDVAAHRAEQPVLSDILRVRADYLLQGAPLSAALVVKLLPREPFQRYFVNEAQFDLREIKFYTEVAGDVESFSKEVGYPLQLPIPRLYHASYSGDAEPPSSPGAPPTSVLVLEDLTVSGYAVPSFSGGLSLSQAESALRAVAKLHAASLGLKLKNRSPLDQIYPFLFQTAKATDSYQQLVERGLPQLARFLEGRSDTKGVMKALGSLKPDTKELISSLLAPREPMGLITHTDFWCNNLAFTDEEVPQCKILDWQMVTYSRPTNDIALLILSSLPTDCRRSSTHHLLDVYWTEFTALCSSLSIDLASIPYDRNQLDADYRESQLLALLLCIGSVDVALGNPTTELRLHDLLQDLYLDGVLSKHIIQTENLSC